MNSDSHKWYRKEQGRWAYTLARPMAFSVPELHLGVLEIRSLQGHLLARTSQDGILAIASGYSWDGCTAIGRLIETQATLRASLLHDLLYQMAEQSRYKVPFNQLAADRAFKRYLPCWARLIWYGGVRAFGWAFYGDTQDSLLITTKQ